MGRLEEIPGVSIIDDIRLGHTFYEVNVLKKIIKEYQPLNFFEIGVHEGGLSYLLIPQMPLDCHYTGIEINCGFVQPKVYEMYQNIAHSSLICLDCFNEAIFTFIQWSSHKIIYCDGGNKAKEILHFKEACNSGDIILCHDYYDGKRIVKDVPLDRLVAEVTVDDIQCYEQDQSFERMPEDLLKKTRMIGWKKK